MNIYSESELILNPDGSIFHLRLFPEQVSDHVILVGDSGRVALVGQFLENTENLASNREFQSITGNFNGTRITVLSTGIGTDNIDIVVNELDALVNIDLETRKDLPVRRRLNLVRIGTSGSLQEDIPAGTPVASAWSIGLDGVMNYYRRPQDPERDRFERSLKESTGWPTNLPDPYGARASGKLLKLVEPHYQSGITVAAHGFYGPQGRRLRAPLSVPGLNNRLQNFLFGSYRTTNFEMESSALYGLSEVLGHDALTVCLIIANRMTGNFTGDYHSAMEGLIHNMLNLITQ
jgi:uridine phosphorylase